METKKPVFLVILGIILILLITLFSRDLRTKLNFRKNKTKEAPKPQIFVTNSMHIQQVATAQPTGSKAKTPVKKPLPNSPTKPRFLLNGIFASDKFTTYALINNQIAKVGDRIDGALVKRINQDSVELESESKSIILTSESKWSPPA